MRHANCHPERKHKAKGLCRPCYVELRSRWRYYNVARKPVTRSYRNKFAKCHPDRPYHAKGLCASCCATKWSKARADSDSGYHSVRRRRQRWQYHKPGSNQRNTWYLKKYGITLADYEQLLQKQKGVCAICKRSARVRLGVDHNHTTKTVRGLLCPYCNYLVGVIESKGKTYFLEAIKYVEFHNRLEIIKH